MESFIIFSNTGDQQLFQINSSRSGIFFKTVKLQSLCPISFTAQAYSVTIVL